MSWPLFVIACPICFQFEPGATSEGLRAAIFVLVSVTGCVLAGFGVFIMRFIRRQ